MPVTMTRATPPPSAPVLWHVIFWKKGGARASTWAVLPASTSDWLEALYVVLAGLKPIWPVPGGGNQFSAARCRLVVLDKADRVIRPSSQVTGGAARPSMESSLTCWDWSLPSTPMTAVWGCAAGQRASAASRCGRSGSGGDPRRGPLLPDPEHHYLYAGRIPAITPQEYSPALPAHLTEVEHPSDGLIENQ